MAQCNNKREMKRFRTTVKTKKNKIVERVINLDEFASKAFIYHGANSSSTMDDLESCRVHI